MASFLSLIAVAFVAVRLHLVGRMLSQVGSPIVAVHVLGSQHIFFSCKGSRGSFDVAGGYTSFKAKSHMF